MKFAHAKRDRVLNLDMTPMIDIVFQLLIFFLTTAQMAQMARTTVSLPTERGEQEKSKDLAGMVINLDAAGIIVVNDATITVEELQYMAADLAARSVGAAAAKDPSAFRPLVRADRNAPAERLNGVLNALERAGVKAVRIGTAPPKDGGPGRGR